MRLRAMVLVLVVAVMLVGCKAVGPAAGLPKGSVVLEAEKFAEQKNVRVNSYPGASAGKAVLMDKYNSKISTTVTLEAGKYQVVLVGLAKDSEEDALALKLSAPGLGISTYWEERVYFDEAADEFVTASVIPTVTLAKKGDVKVIVQVDDEIGVALDRVEFRKVEK